MKKVTYRNALSEIFGHSSQPFMTSDDATDLHGSSNAAFLQRIDVSHLLIKPLHTAANGFVQCHMDKLQSMICKTAHDSPSPYQLKLTLTICRNYQKT
jgi:hypothetical protein